MSLPVTVKPTNGYWLIIQALYFSVIGIYVMLIIPCTVYYWKIIWSLRKEKFFAKRFPRLTMAGLMMWNIYLVVFRTIADLPKIIPSLTFKSAEIYIRLAFYNLAHIVLVGMFIRFWFLYYNYQLGVQLVFKEFRTQVTTEDHDVGLWTMRYNCLSHKSHTLYYLGALWVVIVQISVLASGSASFIVQPLFMLLIFIPLCIVGFKIRSCRDKLCIRQECLYICYAGICFIGCYIIIKCIFDDELKALFDCLCISIVGAVISAITTKWVLTRMLQINNERYIDRTKLTSNALRKNRVRVNLDDVIQHPDAFDLFAIHCVKELSIENILFLFEITKFKNECNAYGLINDDQMGRTLKFPNKTGDIKRVRSRVNSVDDFEYNLQYIYQRYVDPSAEFAVNISYETRAKIQLKLGIETPNVSIVPHGSPKMMHVQTHSKTRSIEMGNIQLSQLSHTNDEQKEVEADVETNEALECIQMLNEAQYEVYHLLENDSLFRFSQTEEFKKIFES